MCGIYGRGIRSPLSPGCLPQISSELRFASILRFQPGFPAKAFAVRSLRLKLPSRAGETRLHLLIESRVRERGTSGAGRSGDRSFAALEPLHKAPKQENADEKSVLQRLAPVGLDEPVVVDDSGDGRDVDESMKNLPAATTEAANPAGGGSQRKRDQQDESEKADGDEGALIDVLPHVAEVEGLVGAKIREEVQADVEKREQAEHAAKPYELGKIEDFSQRSHRQRENEKKQSPVAGGVLKRFDGIGTEVALQRAEAKRKKRDKANEKHQRLCPLAAEESAHADDPPQ